MSWGKPKPAPKPKPECPKGNGHQIKFPADLDDDGNYWHTCRKCKTKWKQPKGGKK